MEEKKQFKRLHFGNMGDYYHARKLKKGSLIRYRYSYDTISTYGLDETANDWQIGVVSHINWYVVPPYSTYGIHIETGEAVGKDRICYDISVHNVTDPNGAELVNLEANEIFLLTD